MLQNDARVCDLFDFEETGKLGPCADTVMGGALVAWGVIGLAFWDVP